MSVGSYNPGDIFMGRYRIERVLGSGNMGLVVSATHVGLDQRVAIKFMLPGKAPTEQHQRFLREARACAKLKTQHVAKALDVGMTPEGAPYMVMEFLEGRDLAAELAARGPLPFAEAVDYVLQACEAVAEAHAAGIVHRDLKPANLFLTRGGDGTPCVKVLDFGISKMGGTGLALTSDMQALGSPLYMSPEQMDSAKDVDVRTDIWAIGVTLYELVAGLTPFHADRIEELCTRVYLKPPTPLSTYRADAPRAFEPVLLQCLEKDRARRYATVGAPAAALAPFGGPDAARHAQTAAALLGEQVVPARPTDVLPSDPTPAPARPVAPEAGTGGAVVRPATGTPAHAARRGTVVALGVGLGGVVLSALGFVGWRLHAGPAALPPTISAAAQTATSAPPPVSAANAAPPASATAPAPVIAMPGADAGAADADAPAGSTSSPPSTAGPAPKSKAPHTPPAKTAAEAPGPAPSAKTRKDPYAQ